MQIIKKILPFLGYLLGIWVVLMVINTIIWAMIGLTDITDFYKVEINKFLFVPAFLLANKLDNKK